MHFGVSAGYGARALSGAQLPKRFAHHKAPSESGGEVGWSTCPEFPRGLLPWDAVNGLAWCGTSCLGAKGPTSHGHRMALQQQPGRSCLLCSAGAQAPCPT